MKAVPKIEFWCILDIFEMATKVYNISKYYFRILRDLLVSQFLS